MALSAKTVKPSAFSAQDTVFDVIPDIEARITSSWHHRSIFIETLSRIAAVTEHDAMDNSFASVLVRARVARRFVVCSVDFRLTYAFPAVKPLVTVHGLQDGYAKLIEDNALPYNTQWDAVKIAKMLYCAVCDIILSSLEEQKDSTSS